MSDTETTETHRSSPPKVAEPGLLDERQALLVTDEVSKEEDERTKEKTRDGSISVNVESTLGCLQGREVISVHPEDRVERIVEKFVSLFSTNPGSTYILRDLNGLIIRSSKTVAAAGIEDGANLYLSTLESERALFSYTNWWQVALLCAAFCLSIFGGSLGAYFSANSPPYIYNIVIDAGSVHTSVYTYRFSGEKQNGTGVIEQVYYCGSPEGKGISRFYGNPAAVRKYINSTCVRDTYHNITGKRVGQIFLGGTAGMRTLRIMDPEGAGWIMGNLTKALVDISGNNQSRAEILDGESEGLYGWVTANYLEHTLGHPMNSSLSTSFGALDWGGASVELTVEVPEKKANQNVSLYGATYHIHSTSYLCYGQKEALFRHRSSLFYEQYLDSNRTFPTSVVDPCAPEGSHVSHVIHDLFLSPCTQIKDPEFISAALTNSSLVYFNGTADYETCLAASRDHFNFGKCQERYRDYYPVAKVCLNPKDIHGPTASRYHAFSNYYYLITNLRLPQQHSLDRFDKALKWVCTKKARSELLLGGVEEIVVDSVCFKMCFMRNLLTEAYHFNTTTYPRIKYVKSLGGMEVDWSLGNMIMASNDIPARLGKPYISDLMFVVLLIISLGFAVLCLFFAYQARMVSRASRKYQRFGRQP